MTFGRSGPNSSAGRTPRFRKLTARHSRRSCRCWLAITVAIICFTPVVVDGMFSPGYPTLALALGAAIITVFIFVVLHDGLLAGITALTTHFFLMTAPIGLWYIGSVALIGLGGCYLARSGRTWKPERAYSLQRA